MSAPRYDGWVPFRIYWPDREPMAELCYLGSNGFPDPFFETTMHFELLTPFNMLFRRHCSFRDLARWRESSPGLKPAGFIFHASRCGSTLVTQLLAKMPQHLVLSEPEPLDALILSHRPAPQASTEEKVEWLRCLLSALAQPRSGAERRLFVKFDPRAIFALPLLLQAFPGTPWVFVYRDPAEVMVSHQRRRATFVTPGMAGLDLPGLSASMAEDEYMARVLGAIYQQAASQIPHPLGMAVNYRELPEAVWTRIGQHFGVGFSDAEIDGLRQAAVFDAKHPKQRFASDSESKTREASSRVHELAGCWISPWYKKLESRDVL